MPWASSIILEIAAALRYWLALTWLIQPPLSPPAAPPPSEHGRPGPWPHFPGGVRGPPETCQSCYMACGFFPTTVRYPERSLVYCLVNLFRNWQDLWRPPMLFGFCPELLGRRHARCSVLVPSYVVKGNGLSRQPAQRLSRSYLAGWLAGLDPGRNVRPCSSRKRWWV